MGSVIENQKRPDELSFCYAWILMLLKMKKDDAKLLALGFEFVACMEFVTVLCCVWSSLLLLLWESGKTRWALFLLCMDFETTGDEERQCQALALRLWALLHTWILLQFCLVCDLLYSCCLRIRKDQTSFLFVVYGSWCYWWWAFFVHGFCCSLCCLWSSACCSTKD